MDDIKYNNNDDNNSDISDQNIVKGVRHFLSALLHTPSGSHNLIVYSDIRVLRKIYPVYVKSLLDNNEIVLILTYYDHPSMIRQILQNGTNKKSDSIDLKRYVHDCSLVIVDSLMSYFNQNHGYEINNDGKLNFLSLIRILLNHGIKNNKNGITIFSDMGSFFHFGSDPYKSNDDINHKIFEYEKSIPTMYKELELKKFCLYHQKDYESHFTSTRQKAQLLDCHGRSILVMDNNNR